MSLDVPGGYDSEELAAIRRLSRELAADGYRVAKVAIGPGGEPVALVYGGRPGDPIRRMIVAARSFLRAVEDLEVPDGPSAIEVSPEELETLAALRLTSLSVTNVVAAREPETVGEIAHVEFARAALRGTDAED